MHCSPTYGSARHGSMKICTGVMSGGGGDGGVVALATAAMSSAKAVADRPMACGCLPLIAADRGRR